MSVRVFDGCLVTASGPNMGKREGISVREAGEHVPWACCPPGRARCPPGRCRRRSAWCRGPSVPHGARTAKGKGCMGGDSIMR